MLSNSLIYKGFRENWMGWKRIKQGSIIEKNFDYGNEMSNFVGCYKNDSPL